MCQRQPRALTTGRPVTQIVNRDPVSNDFAAHELKRIACHIGERIRHALAGDESIFKELREENAGTSKTRAVARVYGLSNFMRTQDQLLTNAIRWQATGAALDSHSTALSTQRVVIACTPIIDYAKP